MCVLYPLRFFFMHRLTQRGLLVYRYRGHKLAFLGYQGVMLISHFSASLRLTNAMTRFDLTLNLSLKLCSYEGTQYILCNAKQIILRYKKKKYS